jgi:hypothetical protein
MNDRPPQQIDAAISAMVREIAERLSKSGPFEGASPAQLEARIWIGLALGIDPGTACSNINFSRGKATFSAALQASLLARSAKYDYAVIEASEVKCSIQFICNAKHHGIAIFTIDEAKRAGLTSKSVWQAYPSDLLFARCLTRGIRRFAPDLLAGSAAYTAEETGADHHEPVPTKKQTAPPAAEKPTRGTVTDQQLDDIKCAKDILAIPPDAWHAIVAKRGAESAVYLSTEKAAELISSLKTRINAIQFEERLAGKDNGDLTVNMTVGKAKEVEAAGPAGKSD